MIVDDRTPLQPMRALLGWMTEQEALLALAGRREDQAKTPEHEERVRQKRLVASVRRPAFGARGVVRARPQSRQQYAAVLGETRQGAALLADGWQPGLVDLRKVCAIAPMALADVDLPDVGGDDLEALAAITLEPAATSPVEAAYDSELRTWIVREPIDLEIAGQFQTAGQPGFVVGLVIAHSPSFLTVTRAGDRFVLLDGYHRAVTLLARGIHLVPALVRAQGRRRDLPFGRRTLARAAVLGRRPPLLPDFLDDDVSAEVLIPRTTRLLMVRATDFAYYHSD